MTVVNWRVVVSDRDPFLNGAIAHFLGVGLKVALSRSVVSVAVEVLGATNLSDPRMARVQSERFAARHINHTAPVVGVLQIVTLTGCGSAPVELNYLRRCVPCALSLARFELDNSLDSAMMRVDDTHAAFKMHPNASALVEQPERVADLCRVASLEIVARLNAGG
jgi:hypothetical protein